MVLEKHILAVGRKLMEYGLNKVIYQHFLIHQSTNTNEEIRALVKMLFFILTKTPNLFKLYKIRVKGAQI